MKIFSFALPASLLVLSFIACNHRVADKKNSMDAALVSSLDRLSVR